MRNTTILLVLWFALSLLPANAILYAQDHPEIEYATTQQYKTFNAATLELNHPIDLLITKQAGIPVYSLETFGSVKLGVQLTSHSVEQPVILVDGPYNSLDEAKNVFTSSTQVFSNTKNNKVVTVTLNLAREGVYRIIPITQNILKSGTIKRTSKLRLKSSCQGVCYRPTISIDDLIEEKLSDPHSRQMFQQYVLGKINQINIDQTIKDVLIERINQLIFEADSINFQLDRLFTFKLRYVKEVFALINEFELKGDEAVEISDDEKFDFNSIENLAAYLQDCNGHSQYYDPQTVIELPVGAIARGSWARRSLSTCQIHQSDMITALFNSLTKTNTVNVNFAFGKVNTNIQTIEDMIHALLSTGHSITLSKEKGFADFLSLVYKDSSNNLQAIRWPTWIDTTIPISDSANTLTVPTPHIHFAWLITGPLVNVKICFYLGKTGLAFYADTYDQKIWKIPVTEYSISTVFHDKSSIIKSFKLANDYVKLNQYETTLDNKNMLYDGYGYTGVCTDSTAFIEYGLFKNTVLFPLARSHELNDRLTSYNTEVTDILNALPSDVYFNYVSADDSAKGDFVLRLFKTMPSKKYWKELQLYFGSKLYQDLLATSYLN